ncbi:unnamed protein product [Rotaria magnacalcarata]|uniref:Uncharacterized protein n=1 Tax=Rotaria magnacalcarata TaxID=392030 RepID=A0A814R366_9BILA|nr:unnamed protein product [Rotaria magnacalcarata]CAF1631970.1 unnamed protein product [Rotaria magnacalcarata]CAF2043091.1 unnamed protein product [Rotaria magnacalcarata]CAF4024131.1 unnamed protein product [Rotaria magnacalcarata]CAF4072877.1 unnamed protein product [Rotaria magnacalcarata]
MLQSILNHPKNENQLTARNFDESFDSSFDQNFTNSTSTPLSTAAPMSPQSAVRSIISSCLQDKNLSAQPVPVKTNSRVRVERKFGEDITNGNLLEELKKKAELKKNKAIKQSVRRSQRLSKKTN